MVDLQIIFGQSFPKLDHQTSEFPAQIYYTPGGHNLSQGNVDHFTEFEVCLTAAVQRFCQKHHKMARLQDAFLQIVRQRNLTKHIGNNPFVMLFIQAALRQLPVHRDSIIQGLLALLIEPKRTALRIHGLKCLMIRNPQRAQVRLQSTARHAEFSGRQRGGERVV